MYVMFIFLRKSSFLSCAAAILLCSIACHARNTYTSNISASSIKSAVESLDFLAKESKQQIYTSYSNGIASVSLFRHPEATKADCKIDTVLLARRVIALAPKEVKLVRCVFYDMDRQNEFWEVEIRAQLVAAFGNGEIGEHDLINSILLTEDRQKNPLSEKYAALSYSGILGFNGVVPGAYEAKRLAIHLRLEELEKQKVEIGRFREDFLRIEDAARRGHDKDLANQVNSLNKNLDQYVDQMISSGMMQKPELKRAKNSVLEQTPKI